MKRSTLVGQLFTQMMLLFVLFAVASLLTVVKFLPEDPLALSLPFMQISGVAHVWMELVLLTGILAVSMQSISDEVDGLSALVYRLWTAFLLITVLAGLMGYYTGQYYLELPVLLDTMLVLLLIGWVIVILKSMDSASKMPLIVGFLVIGIGIVTNLVPINNPLTDRVLRVVSVNLRFFVGYPMMFFALIALRQDTISIERVASAIMIVGSLASVTSLTAIGIFSLPVILMVLILLMGSIYVLAEIARKTRSWQRIGCILIVLSIGGVGIIFASPIGSYALGTQLSTLQFDLVSWGGLLIILGALSQYIHGEQKTNSISYWLIVGGIVVSTQTLLIIGSVQTILERDLSIGYLDTQSVLVPLYMLWSIATILWSLGAAYYCLQVFSQQLYLPPQLETRTQS